MEVAPSRRVQTHALLPERAPTIAAIQGHLSVESGLRLRLDLAGEMRQVATPHHHMSSSEAARSGAVPVRNARCELDAANSLTTPGAREVTRPLCDYPSGIAPRVSDNRLGEERERLEVDTDLRSNCDFFEGRKK